MSNRKQHPFRPTLTVLEGRDVPSVSTVTLANQVLTVKAGPATTNIVVTEAANGNVIVQDVGTNRRWGYAAAQVGEVMLIAGAGSDTITAVNNDPNPAKAKFLDFVGSPASTAIIGARVTGNIVTIFTATPVQGLAAGSQVSIAGLSPAAYDGTATVTSAIGNRFTYVVKPGVYDLVKGLANPTLNNATVSGVERFTSTGFPVSMVAGSGDDTLSAPSGNATLVGGTGQDWIAGGSGDDLLVAGSGDQYLNGGTGVATLVAGIGNDTIVAMNGQASDTVQTGPGTAVIWTDSVGGVTDNIVGDTTNVTIQAVAGFANGPSNVLDGGTFTEPTLLAGNPQGSYQPFTNVPLFTPAGPTYQDVNQYINAKLAAAGGGVAGTGTTLDDSWLLAGLGAIADVNPTTIEKNVVDFGDGTYGVALGGNYYRVDNQLPVNLHGQTFSAYASVTSSMWVPIVEKAYAYYYANSQPSYQALAAANGGTTQSVYTAFGATTAGSTALNGPTGFPTQAALGAAILAAFQNNNEICIGLTAAVAGTDYDTGAAVNLPANREYTVVGVGYNNATGQVNGVFLRDPDGANRDGVYVSLANLYAASGTLDTGNA
jgi:hypothetical protein